MTPEQRERAFKAELARQAKRLSRIQRDTVAEILAQLRAAEAKIAAELAKVGTTAVRRAKLQQLRAAVAAAMRTFERAAATTATRAADIAWTAGVELALGPLQAAGLAIAPTINPRALVAMREFLTGRIADITLTSVNRINAALGEVLIGVATSSDAVTAVQQILGVARRRAQTIVYTELGRAHAIASQAAMSEAAKKVPGMRKRWLKSGKLHPRPEHVRAHNQVVPVNEPFTVAGESMMHPRDPSASAKNTINCGCMAVPVVAGSRFGASVFDVPADPNQPVRLISPEERARQNASVIEEANRRLRALGIADPIRPGGVSVSYTMPDGRVITSETEEGLLAQLERERSGP